MNDLRPDHIMQVGFGFWASKTFLSAVEMQVFTELAKHPEPLAELSSRLGLHPRSARDFFDALVALDFLQRNHGVYSNTPETDFFLDKRKPSYIGGILEMANQRLYGHWNHLTTACAPASCRTKRAAAARVPSLPSTPIPPVCVPSSKP